ncbi:MBL fold metallo-hydrolase [Caulobacter sp. SL161]|uniref:MBL fold metallo-hydrolase n=1 Tax=Caulobacter sp. SL161 TaxID=2995156 RepID=UPI002273CF87|nr:MBL fold metallo-hydrolase [Caulobacter sp. SL161]MCY1646505.1 MBL fold metallo-hydrolase [Caulobacter sp. SL161]
MMQPEITSYRHPATGTVSYLVVDPATFLCAIVDPVLDFDPVTEEIDTRFVDAIIADIRAKDLGPTWILETGLHTGHLSAAGHLKYETGASVCIGAGVVESLKRLAPQFGETMVDLDGWDFDKLAQDGDTFPMGGLEITPIALTGRLPGAVAYRMADMVFTGDIVLAPAEGSGRCDIPGADAGKAWDDARKILALPPETRILPGVSTTAACESTVADAKASNIQLNDTIDQLDFIALRTAADAFLPDPELAAAALRVAIRAGRPPSPPESGPRFPSVDLSKL